MFIRIEKASSVPISRQIAEQIRAACLSRGINPGDRLPSVRQLARELAVNQNTILRVYEQLTAEGMLERRHGEGTFVANDPPVWKLNGQRKRYAEELRRLARQGLMLGLSASEVQKLLDEALREEGERGEG